MTSSVPDMPGIKAEYPLVDQFRQEVAQLLGRTNKNFPGAQPVSFSARHLQELQSDEYVVVMSALSKNWKLTVIRLIATLFAKRQMACDACSTSVPTPTARNSTT
jgi:hypothetical protein